MARKTKDLTALRVEKLKEPGRYHDNGHRGLYLQIGPTLTKSWLLRYEYAGKERWHGLGSAKDFSLKEARERARAKRQLLADNIDPIEAKIAAKDLAVKEARERQTFRAAADEFLRLHADTWKNAKHRHQWQATLRQHAFPKLGDRAVASIDSAMVNDAVADIWTKTPVTARRARARIERIVKWVRDGKPLPNRDKNGERNHYAAMPWQQVPEFMAELRQRDGVSARALEFAILTAARTGEVTGARWDEIVGDVWTVPASRMKGNREHRVPLSAPVVELLSKMHREAGNEYVFIGARKGVGLSTAAMLEMLRRMRPGLTTHGFRSSFTDWAHETTSTPPTVVEMALAHAVANETEAAYRRGDLLPKRRKLMTEWARYCASTPADVDTSLNERRKARRP